MGNSYKVFAGWPQNFALKEMGKGALGPASQLVVAFSKKLHIFPGRPFPFGASKQRRGVVGCHELIFASERVKPAAHTAKGVIIIQ